MGVIGLDLDVLNSDGQQPEQVWLFDGDANLRYPRFKDDSERTTLDTPNKNNGGPSCASDLNSNTVLKLAKSNTVTMSFSRGEKNTIKGVPICWKLLTGDNNPTRTKSVAKRTISNLADVLVRDVKS